MASSDKWLDLLKEDVEVPAINRRPRGDAHWSRKLKNQMLLLNTFIETRDLKQDFENFTASQAQSSEPATSVVCDDLKHVVPVIHSTVLLDDGGDEQSEPEGGDDPSGSSPSSSETTQPFLTVIVAFEGECHHFALAENKCNIMNLVFRTAARLNLPWHQLVFEVEGQRLDDHEDLWLYAPDDVDETLGLVVRVGLLLDENAVMRDPVNVIVLEQYGQRRQFDLMLTNFMFVNIKDYVQDYLSEVLRMENRDLRLHFNNIRIEEEHVTAHPAVGDELLMMLSITGEGGVLHRSQLQVEALETLKNKVIKSVKKTKAPANTNHPQGFSDYVNQFKRKMQDIAFMKSQGNNVMEAGIRSLTDEQLQMVKEIMDFNQSKRRGSSEERLQKAVSTLFPLHQELDSAIKTLQCVQEELMIQMLTTYTEEFNTFTGSSMVLDNGAFLREVEDDFALVKGRGNAHLQRKAVKIPQM